MKIKLESFFPSIAEIFFLSIFISQSLLPVHAVSFLADGDTGYHIRAGEYILNTRSVPHQDIFSFIEPPLPWTAHEWLSEVFMALIHKAFGLTGVVIFFTFLISVIFYLLFKRVRAEGNLLLGAGILVLALAASITHWLARPHIFSQLLFTVWYFSLDAYQYRNKRVLLFLPPLMMLWVNLHGGFILGFLLLGVYLTGNAVKFLFSKGKEREGCREKIKMLGFATLACLVFALVNPYGFRILAFPFEFVSNKWVMNHVVEFMSPNFHGYSPFKHLLLLTLAILAFSKARLSAIETILLLLFSYLALQSMRHAPLFAIILSPILARQADTLLRQSNGRWVDLFRRFSERMTKVERSLRGVHWPILGLVIVIGWVSFFKVEYRFDEKRFPVAALRFIQQEKIPGRMFNNDEFGDYFIYAAWPEYKVFFDGRSDMYGDRLEEYLRVTTLRPRWEEVLAKYDINWVISPSSGALSLLLKEREDWKLIYSDKVAAIFIKNTAANQRWIHRYPQVSLTFDKGA